jgi:prepilin-type N-terminal cleavage/methylation domain-containing protein
MRDNRVVRTDGRLSPYCSAGLTLLELLVALSVIGILAGLLLPAVQSGREAARRVECANHLKQIGIALSSYAGTYVLFPAINAPTGRIKDHSNPYSAHYYSPLVRMLPELEQSPLFNSVNFSWSPSEVVALNANLTAMTIRMSQFLCPSDSNALVAGFGRVGYRFNVGSTPWHSPGDNRPDSWSGPFSTHRFYGPADFADGLSNTVGVSERLQGDWTKGDFSPGDYLLTNIGDTGKQTGAEWALETCSIASPVLPHESRSGESWFLSGHHFTNYNHCATPNAKIHDCSFLNIVEGLHNRTLHEGVFTARSHHLGGVNALLMDGSVRFVRDGIALATWRALATRAGGEVISTLD